MHRGTAVTWGTWGPPSAKWQEDRCVIGGPGQPRGVEDRCVIGGPRPPLGSRTAVLGTGLAPPPFGTLCARRWGRHLALAVGTTRCCGGLVPAHSRCSVHPLHTVAAPVKAQRGQREGGQPCAPAGGPGRGRQVGTGGGRHRKQGRSPAGQGVRSLAKCCSPGGLL